MKKLVSKHLCSCKKKNSCLALTLRVPHLSRDGVLQSKLSTVMTGKATRSHWNKTLPSTPPSTTFSYSAPSSEKTNQKPPSYSSGSCWSWVPPLKESTKTQYCRVLWQQEPTSQILGIWDTLGTPWQAEGGMPQDLLLLWSNCSSWCVPD